MSKNEICGFCGDEEREIQSDTDVQVELYKSGDKWRICYLADIYGASEDLFTFNYCPMCGKELTEVSDRE